MGLLTEGEPLSWYEIKPLAAELKRLGIEQFIRLYDRFKNRPDDSLKWGDEIEYIIVRLDKEKKRARLALKASSTLNELMKKEKEEPGENEFMWRPEFAEFMIEGMPGSPYGSSPDLQGLVHVEENMRRRRQEARALLDREEYVVTLPCFPRIGCPDFTWPKTRPNPDGEISHSLFYPEEAISDFFPRFKLSAKNLRQRRGSNVSINVPIFKDDLTPRPFREHWIPDAEDDHVYMDATGCGTGCCALQVTIQAANMDEARWLYDQLTPITPIMLALSAGTPVCRGYLVDVDCRWKIVAEASDDRTEAERGLGTVENEQVIRKGRHGTIECYIHPCSATYNDVEVQYEKCHFDRLIEAGIDPMLAQHVANLFIRDPLQVFRENVENVEHAENDDSCMYFEDIQSSNWKNIRFKPPPPDVSSIGWRVEFRTMDVQLTDFENAAYVAFVVLLTRAILSSRLSFLIPISKVDENMQRAQKRNAVLTEKFYFRKYVAGTNTQSTCNGIDEYEEMTMDEIINGKEERFPGLIPLINAYLDSVDLDLETRSKIEEYLSLIRGRANGRIWTLARFMREFISQHPQYKKDSQVSDEVCYDLVKTMCDIYDGRKYSTGIHMVNSFERLCNGFLNDAKKIDKTI